MMLNLYFAKIDTGYKVYNQLTDQCYGEIASIDELDRFIDATLGGYITHQSFEGDLYGWIPTKAYGLFRAWFKAPSNLDMRIVPKNDFRQSNALRVEVIPPETRCLLQPRDTRAKKLMERNDGWYHAQHCWSSFGYCVCTKCSLCHHYHKMITEGGA